MKAFAVNAQSVCMMIRHGAPSSALSRRSLLVGNYPPTNSSTLAMPHIANAMHLSGMHHTRSRINRHFWGLFTCKQPCLYYSLSSFIPGQIVQGFTVQEVKAIRELDLVAYLLVHSASKAQYLHLNRPEDSNNVFAVAFPTLPTNSTGVAHILEHLVLCGSKRFPIRDPFFKMLTRSLSSYMNAWTASDYTMYPFSTTHPVDYRNLRDIYMDAVFRPLLSKEDFWQEGWRLEHDKTENALHGYSLKGVVYNEMKGALYSDNEALFATRLEQAMFPGTIYEHVSGGDPLSIPTLTHAALVEFYKKHYHPINARFYTCGNIPLEDHLSYLDKYINSLLEHEHPPQTPDLPSKQSVPFERVFAEPRHLSITGAPDPMCPDPERQAKFAISFLANDISDLQETFQCSLLSQLLLDGPSSPLYQALIDTKLGSEYAPTSGYDTSTPRATFTFGVQGADHADIDKIEKTIRRVLHDCSKSASWFSKNRIDAILHNIELSQKHKSASFGLRVGGNIMKNWTKSISPMDLLSLNEQIETFQREFKQNEHLFENLVAKYLTTSASPHQVILTMKPDAQFHHVLAEKEQQLISSMPKNEEEIEFNTVHLQQAQSRQEDLSILPTLTSGSISSTVPRDIHWNQDMKQVVLDNAVHVSYPMFHRPLTTNGLVYFNMLQELQQTSSTEIGDIGKHLHLPILCSAMTGLGLTDKTIETYHEEVKISTGGIQLEPWMLLDPNSLDANSYRIGIHISSFCMNRNSPKMFNLVMETLSKTNFTDLNRLATIIQGAASMAMNSISDSSHSYAKSFACAQLHPAMYVSDLQSGLSQVFFLNQLAQQLDGRIEKIAQSLQFYRDMWIMNPAFIHTKNSVRCNILADDSVSMDVCKEMHNSLITRHMQSILTKVINTNTSRLAKDSIGTGIPIIDKEDRNIWFAMPFPVAGTAMSMLTVPRMHPDSPKFRLLASIISSKYLHKEIREKNGAYGGGASFSTSSGILSFYSYRDPSPLASISIFRTSMAWFLEESAKKTITNTDLEEAKLSIFKQIDAPIDSVSEGMDYFLADWTSEQANLQRKRLLDTKTEDLVELVQRWFGSPQQEDPFISVIIGCGDIIEQQRSNIQRIEAWKIIRP